MADRITALNNAQQLEVAVSGPDGANRLFLCSGEAPAFARATNRDESNSWTFLVGPFLRRREFIRAIVSAGITKFGMQATPGSAALNAGVNWNIQSADADWDDESGLVEVRVEIAVDAATGTDTNVIAFLNAISYNVSILAALP